MKADMRIFHMGPGSQGPVCVYIRQNLGKCTF